MLNQQQTIFRDHALALSKSIAPQYSLDWRLMAAAAILESGWGQSELSREACNFFGICALPYAPKEQVWNLESSQGSHKFRRYEKEEESFHDYGRLLSRSRSYARARQAALQAFIRFMAPVYCPNDPDYGLKLQQIIKLLPDPAHDRNQVKNRQQD